MHVKCTVEVSSHQEIDAFRTTEAEVATQVSEEVKIVASKYTL
jgi:hypothetical protein